MLTSDFVLDYKMWAVKLLQASSYKYKDSMYFIIYSSSTNLPVYNLCVCVCTAHVCVF